MPDTYGRTLFDRWLALTGRISGNAVETLCFLGKRCMGALEFEPAMDAPYGPDVRIELDSLVEVASCWPLMARECEVPKPMIDAIVPNLKLSI